ncbi:MAG: envelope stress response membrane protein PspB [Proteobacteria bacterium]|jgi:phage shock protein B|nr:envelope stress response membrane protein PspB [Pseudomonadota bacterium]
MGLEFFFVPMVLFMVIVAPIWIVMHYRSVSRSSRSLSDDDRESIDTMLVTVDKLNERIVSLEAILEADHPNWKQQEHTRGES